MPMFFFDFDDTAPDDIGTDLPTLAEAELDARNTLLATAAKSLSRRGHVAIRDAAGQIVSHVSFSIDVIRADGRA